MSTVTITRLYRLESSNPPMRHVDGPSRDLKPGAVLWCHGSRRSTLGGYIGIYSEAYRHFGGWSPRAGRFEMKTEHVSPIH